MSGMKKWAVIAAAVATMCTGSMAFAWGGASSDKGTSDKGTSSGKMDQSSQGLSDQGTAPDKKQPFDQKRSPEQSKQQTQPGSSGTSQY